MKTGVIVVLGAWALVGCATPYQPQAFRGGYADLALNTEMFRVTFEGNGYTRAGRVADFALLRAAEVVIERGGTHFVLVGQDRGTDSALIPGGATSGTLRPTLGGGYAYSGSTAGPVLITKHRAELTVHIVPRGTPAAYDASLVRTQIRERYGLAE